MQFIVVMLLMLLTSYTAVAQMDYTVVDQVGRQLYLSTDEHILTSVYSGDGRDLSDCGWRLNCKPVDPLPPSAQIFYMGKKNMLIKDPYTGEMQDTLMYQVKYVDGVGKDKKIGSGWIEAGVLSSHKRVFVFRPIKSPQSRSSPPNPLPEKKRYRGSDCSSKQHNATDINGLAELFEPDATEAQIHQDAEVLIKSGVGKCIGTQAEISKKLYPQWEKKEFIYDAVVLPPMKKIKPPAIKGENGKFITQEQLREVDVLARTVYAEMVGCFKHGLRFPRGVAKVTFNRVNYYENDPDGKGTTEFVNGNHHPYKGNFSKVLTTDKMYSPWNKVRKQKEPENYKALRFVLCPPRSLSEPYWADYKPSQTEVEYFHESVKIAMEAVLYPERIQARTPELTQFFFTSGKGKFYDMQQDFPAIDGEKININKCLEIWDGVPEKTRVAQKNNQSKS